MDVSTKLVRNFCKAPDLSQDLINSATAYPKFTSVVKCYDAPNN